MINIHDIAKNTPTKWGDISQKIDENLRDTGGLRTVEFTTDKLITRKLIKLEERKLGLILNYNHPTENFISERFIGLNTSDVEWEKDSNWESIVGQTKLTESLKTIEGFIERKLDIEYEDGSTESFQILTKKL